MEWILKGKKWCSWVCIRVLDRRGKRERKRGGGGIGRGLGDGWGCVQRDSVLLGIFLSDFLSFYPKKS